MKKFLLAAGALLSLFFSPPAKTQEVVAVEGQPASVEVDFYAELVKAALERTTHQVRYDPAYVVLEYPGGDVPPETGVCTDVVVRTYRALGIDLQKLVHEDMKSNFSKYPKNWGLKRADKNIDHRRVPNLQKYFSRIGASLKISDDVSDYKPGDVVAWDLNNRGLTHIGVVVGEDEIVHNIGAGPKLEKGVLSWKVIGHYRFKPTEWKPVKVEEKPEATSPAPAAADQE